MLHDEVVGDQDAVERPDRGAQRVQRVVDHVRRVEQVPGHHEHRAHRRDHPAADEGDVLGRHVGEVEGRRDEVGDDVDADGGDDEGRGPRTAATVLSTRATISTGSWMYSPNTGSVAEVVITVTIEKAMKLTGRPQKLPFLTDGMSFAEAREVAEVDHRAGEVGDDQRDRDDHLPEARRARCTSPQPA